MMSRIQAAARLLPGISVCTPNETTRHVNLQGERLDGSDGTRTRHLRRDRPVRRKRPQSATARNYHLQQAFRRFANRLRPATTGHDPAQPVWNMCGRRGAYFDNGSDVVRVRDFYSTTG
jgi:hypothetical protein